MSVPPQALQQRQSGTRAQSASPQTTTSTAWKGLNVTDSRLSIDDDELAVCENGMLVGKGVQSVGLFNGAAGVALHAGSLVKESFSTQLTYGSNTIPHPVVIVVFEDGSAFMRDLFLDGALDSQIAAAGTFSASPSRTDIAIWQDGPVLFMDDQAGYAKWDGTTFTLLDATKVGHALQVFEGHVWLLTAPRTITYTAPNSFSDFTAGNGAGSFKITDEAFQGPVVHLFSTVEQLWLMGVSAIDALGNVATAAGVTTFSVTNALTSLGTAFADSLYGYYRALTFATGYSIHSLLGVTPQKLSGKIDGLFPLLKGAIAAGPRAAVVQLNGFLVLAFIYQFTDPVTGAVSTKLLCFQESKWFTATTPDLGGNRVLDIVSVTVRTTPELYGIDSGGFVYRIFARAGDPVQGTMTLASRLHDFGQPTTGHQAIRLGLDLSAPATTGIAKLTVILTSEAGTATQAADQAFAAVYDSPVGTRYALYRANAPRIGQRIGWTLQVPCRHGVRLEAAHLEIGETGDWETQRTTAVTWDFSGAGGAVFQFTGLNGVPFSWEGVSNP